MSEIFLDCDSPCVSCPFNRIFKIGNFNGRHLRGSYYCVNDGILYLCKRGVGFRMVKGQLRPFCPRCDRELGQIQLSYNQGKDFRPFEDDILLVVRIPLQSRFDITKVLRGSYFKDLSEILLYILYALGPELYDVVNYDTLTKNYNTIFTGNIAVENIAIKSDTPTTFNPQITFD